MTSRSRWILRGALAAFTLVWLVVLLVSRGDDAGEEIGDTRFIRAAESVCAEIGVKIRDRLPPGSNASFEERAASVDRIRGLLEEMARRLRALPVIPADADAVDRWLSNLESFNIVGRRYAGAIRSGDEKAIARVGHEGDRPNAAFNATSRRNDIDNCVLG